MKTHALKWIIAIAVFALVLSCFLIRPLVAAPDKCKIISVMYRADGDTLRYFYPRQDGPAIAQEALLQSLRGSRAMRSFVSPTAVTGIPMDDVTLWIVLSENGKEKIILLGDLNELVVQEKSAAYRILRSDRVMEELLAILEIGNDFDPSALPPVASSG